MSAAAPWSVKGIDPKAREIAKDLARRQGLTLGDWLNRMILEDSAEAPAGGGEAPPFAAEELGQLRAALDRLDDKVDSAERRSTLAISGIDQTVRGLLSRLEAAERDQVAVAARFEGALEEVKDGQVRADKRLAHVEEAAAQPRSIEALRALETALGKVAAHLYDSETRTRESLAQMRADLTGLTEQVGQAGEAEPASQVMIDGVVSRIVQRLEEAEARTSGAVRGLEASVGQMEARLQAAEARGDAPEQRLQQLAQELTRNFDTTRSELAATLEQANGARFEAMERSLRGVSGQVAAAEHRSTQAMERMGREVLRVADALGKRMEGVETRSAEAIEQVGGDVGRIAEVMETRLRRTDQAQAESLERLGGEITRITERLAERVAAAERRSAQAIDDVGDQVSRVTERLNQRQERASSDITERIRQSEERTARLLEEAREKLDQRLAGTERRLSDQVAYKPPLAPTPPPVEDFGSLFAEPDLPPGPFEPEARPAAFAARRGGAPAGFVPPVETLPPDPERSPFEADDFDAASMFEAFEAEAAADGPAPDRIPTDAEADEAAAPVSGPTMFDEPAAPDIFETPAKVSTRELIEQARAAARAAAQREPDKKPGMFAGLPGGGRKKQASKLRAGLMVAAAAATLGVTTAGLMLYSAQEVKRSRMEIASEAAATLAAASALPASASGASGGEAAVALAPHLTGPAAASSNPAGDLPGLYGDAVRRIEAKDSGGLSDLRKAASLGYTPAQFYLAKLYEAGDSGVAKDPVEARLWTQRAAENGERRAMHNLALYYFEGTGGPKNLPSASQWFRKAAGLGLVDSQYNLARLYEGGFGVAQNTAEAYKWYLIAARSGDGESKAAADRLKAQLTPDAQQAASKAALLFRPETPASAGVAVARR